MVKKNNEKMIKKSSAVKSTKKTEQREQEVEHKKKVVRKFGKEKLNADIGSLIYKLCKNMAPDLKVQKKSLQLTNQLTE
jgi:hypothetical protein